MSDKRIEQAEEAAARPMPALSRQAWNLGRSLAEFVSDGCRLVTTDDYRRRLEICDACAERTGNRCRRCGCRLAVKARGRSFSCPLNKWPLATDQQIPAGGDRRS